MTIFAQVTELRSLLDERGLTKSGVKKDLITRLQEHDKQQGLERGGGDAEPTQALEAVASESSGTELHVKEDGKTPSQVPSSPSREPTGTQESAAGASQPKSELKDEAAPVQSPKQSDKELDERAPQEAGKAEAGNENTSIAVWSNEQSPGPRQNPDAEQTTQQGTALDDSNQQRASVSDGPDSADAPARKRKSPDAEAGGDEPAHFKTKHAPTRTLYISGLTRPLVVPRFKEYIQQLNGDGGTRITHFHLDAIRSHAFVMFETAQQADETLKRLVGSRYPPDEMMRNILSVDYVPDERVREWSDMENEGGAGSRFRVHYDDAGHAEFRDARARPAAPAIPEPEPGVKVLKLDELFLKTQTKPSLYYLPVPAHVVEQRKRMFTN